MRTTIIRYNYNNIIYIIYQYIICWINNNIIYHYIICSQSTSNLPLRVICSAILGRKSRICPKIKNSIENGLSFHKQSAVSCDIWVYFWHILPRFDRSFVITRWYSRGDIRVRWFSVDFGLICSENWQIAGHRHSECVLSVRVTRWRTQWF